MPESIMKPSTTRLSTRGQVVIPEEIREALGLEPGTPFVVVAEGDAIMLKRLVPPPAEEFRALLERSRESAKLAGLTPAEVERVIREVRAETKASSSGA